MNQTQFAPRELCERLQKMGCVSESGFYWREGQLFYFEPYDKVFDSDVPAFVQNDFTGATERAYENAKIVWGAEEAYSDYYDGPKIPTCDHYRHEMIDPANGYELWWEHLERTMRK